jgi:hypothetical protein
MLRAGRCQAQAAVAADADSAATLHGRALLAEPCAYLENIDL